jgi:hypothetical protein
MNLSLERTDTLTQRVQSILKRMRNEVDHTRQLHSQGINNFLASSLEDLYTNPLSAFLDMHNSSLFNIKKMVSQLTIGFLTTQKANIIKAFQVDQKNKLVYYVVLKEDKSEIREEFFEFLSVLDEFGIMENIPVMIKFLPERVMDKANLKNELKLN